MTYWWYQTKLVSIPDNPSINSRTTLKKSTGTKSFTLCQLSKAVQHLKDCATVLSQQLVKTVKFGHQKLLSRYKYVINTKITQKG